MESSMSSGLSSSWDSRSSRSGSSTRSISDKGDSAPDTEDNIMNQNLIALDFEEDLVSNSVNPTCSHTSNGKTRQPCGETHAGTIYISKSVQPTLRDIHRTVGFQPGSPPGQTQVEPGGIQNEHWPTGFKFGDSSSRNTLTRSPATSPPFVGLSKSSLLVSETSGSSFGNESGFVILIISPFSSYSSGKEWSSEFGVCKRLAMEMRSVLEVYGRVVQGVLCTHCHMCSKNMDIECKRDKESGGHEEHLEASSVGSSRSSPSKLKTESRRPRLVVLLVVVVVVVVVVVIVLVVAIAAALSNLVLEPSWLSTLSLGLCQRNGWISTMSCHSKERSDCDLRQKWGWGVTVRHLSSVGGSVSVY
uniref:Uncharacterized protein n=1 Tax=Timema tahoe TaxID=61484 RepID=A0A7R9I9Z5_9NEOP|nr:unnamed protein product [Timema tahoe]